MALLVFILSILQGFERFLFGMYCYCLQCLHSISISRIILFYFTTIFVEIQVAVILAMNAVPSELPSNLNLDLHLLVSWLQYFVFSFLMILLAILFKLLHMAYGEVLVPFNLSFVSPHSMTISLPHSFYFSSFVF